MSKFKRTAAVRYAKTHWNVPCHDHCVAIGHAPWYREVPLGTQFVTTPGDAKPELALLPDGSTIPWTELDDCTHYISCCLGPRGGGLHIPHDFSKPYGILGVARLLKHLTHHKLARAVAERTLDRTTVDKLSKGDLIAYYSGHYHRYTHLAMYLGDGKITCHTFCRWELAWDLGGPGFSWSFFHIIA